MLTDPAWLARTVQGAGRRWRTADARVAATLWWYAGASIVVDQAVAALVRDGRGMDVAPEVLDPLVDDDGTLLAVRPRRALAPGAEPLGRSVAELARLLEPLAGASGANLRGLWAITTDALANRLLAHAGDAEGPRLAASVAAACPPLPAPRFVDVPVADIVAAREDLALIGLRVPPGEPAGRRYVRRASCCLIYRTPASDLCVSCPHQSPEIRRRRLVQHAATS